MHSLSNWSYGAILLLPLRVPMEFTNLQAPNVSWEKLLLRAVLLDYVRRLYRGMDNGALSIPRGCCVGFLRVGYAVSDKPAIMWLIQQWLVVLDSVDCDPWVMHDYSDYDFDFLWV